MAHLLVIRFSALGDVAMTIPVIHAFATQYPQHKLTVVSRASFAPLFIDMPDNVHFKGIDLKRYSGLRGLSQLYQTIQEGNRFDAVADWHNVLRTRFLRFRFRLSGIPVAVINKDRRAKHRLTRAKNKVLHPLQTSTERYADVLAQLGYPVQLTFTSLFAGKPTVASPLTGPKPAGEQWIGIAPFAQHKGKIYPTLSMEQVIKQLSGRTNIRLFLFGGGNYEKALCEQWASQYPRTISLIGKGTMRDELTIMHSLDLLLSMDSANMHLASIAGTPVLSVWGATHPYAGFMGWKQNPDNALQTDLPCRPYSVYGNKPCLRGDYACLTQIKPAQIVDHMDRMLHTAAKATPSPTDPDLQ